MRLRLKALAAPTPRRPPPPTPRRVRPFSPARRSARGARADRHADSFAAEIVRALWATGTPERAESPRTSSALTRLEADKTLSRPDRMQALIAQVDLVRIDDSRRTPPSPPRRRKMPDALLAHVREQSARADREITDGYERQAVDHRGRPPARALRPRLRVRRPAQGQSRQEPLALLPDAGLAGMPRGAATSPRRCAGIARPTRRAKARRPGCSGARATCARWSSCRLPTRRRSKAPPRSSGARPRPCPTPSSSAAAALQRVGKKLQAWSQGGAHRASMARLRGELDTLCAAPGRSDADRASASPC